MKRLIMLAAVAAVLSGCDETKDATVASPDGRNVIRLSVNPLAYEVLRDGKAVVARTEIGMTVNGSALKAAGLSRIVREKKSGSEPAAVYKKDRIDLSGNEAYVDFGNWGVRLAARDDGVAYRFETKMPGEITVNGESAPITVPDASVRCWLNYSGGYGQEESQPQAQLFRDIRTAPSKDKSWGGNAMVYLPFAYSTGGSFVVVTESDVRDYPIWNFVSTGAAPGGACRLDSTFARWPKKTVRKDGWDPKEPAIVKGGRKLVITEFEDYCVKTVGTRTYPWRTFILADEPAKVCEADIVRALAAPQAPGDFSWVKPGKVAWDWWNCFDNGAGCNTKTYERFIDFAAKNGVEYVIFDEGWSEHLNIWKYHPNVDVPHLIDYANKKGVGIILWMAWAQVYGDEEHVAEHFAKLGAKGFKVDFMDRGDADVCRFLEKFAAACAKNRMVVDYHGAYRPVGLQRQYPNVLNYEGIHGLEQLKWFAGGAAAETNMMANDVRAFYLRLTAGPMDYTPGAMLNHAVGAGYKGGGSNTPGSVGTRCRQMAMMALYEAPLQMLCDSPTNYEKNMESFEFMAGVPVVWKNTVGLGGCPDSMAVAARQAKDGSWYAAGISDVKARDYTLDTSFLGAGDWKAEIFRDAADANASATHYVHERGKAVKAGEKIIFRMAPGGGFVVKFTK